MVILYGGCFSNFPQINILDQQIDNNLSLWTEVAKKLYTECDFQVATEKSRANNHQFCKMNEQMNQLWFRYNQTRA